MEKVTLTLRYLVPAYTPDIPLHVLSLEHSFSLKYWVGLRFFAFQNNIFEFAMTTAKKKKLHDIHTLKCTEKPLKFNLLKVVRHNLPVPLQKTM